MKKKIIVICAIAVAVLIAAVLYFTNMFTKGQITGKLYRVDNVYEEIWNMVNAEKNGAPTILTTSINGSEVEYDFGCFKQVNIPVNDEYGIVLSFYQEELCIWVFESSGVATCHVYNDQSNTLYSDREESYLSEKFLSLYFSWVGNNGEFNPENVGNYTHVYTEFPLTHE